MRMRFNHGNYGQARTLLLLSSVFLLSRVAVGADIRRASVVQTAKSVSVVLHLSVTVMPVVQTPTNAPAAPLQGPITYRLSTAPLEQAYETHPLIQDANAQLRGERPAILKTLVVVPH